MSPRSLFAIAPLETSRVSDAAYTETVRFEEVLDSKISTRSSIEDGEGELFAEWRQWAQEQEASNCHQEELICRHTTQDLRVSDVAYTERVKTEAVIMVCQPQANQLDDHSCHAIVSTFRLRCLMLSCLSPFSSCNFWSLIALAAILITRDFLVLPRPFVHQCL